MGIRPAIRSMAAGRRLSEPLHRPCAVRGRRDRGPARLGLAGPVALEAAGGVTVAGVARLGAGRLVRHAAAVSGCVARPADADRPRLLGDLDLTETAGRKLRDQGRNQVLGQPIDGGVVRGTCLRRARPTRFRLG